MNHMFKTVEINHVPITWQYNDHELSLNIEVRICCYTLHGLSTSHTFSIVIFYIVTLLRNSLNKFEHNFSGKTVLDEFCNLIVHDISILLCHHREIFNSNVVPILSHTFH